MTTPPASIEGTWQMIRAELNGEAAPDLVTSQTVLELTAGTYAVRYAGQVMDSGTYELGAEPGRMVLHGTNGTNAGRRILCQYQVAGERLRTVFELREGRPTGFADRSAYFSYIVFYKRIL